MLVTDTSMKSGWVKQVLKRALKNHITNLTKGLQRSEYKFQRSENKFDKRRPKIREQSWQRLPNIRQQIWQKANETKTLHFNDYSICLQSLYWNLICTLQIQYLASFNIKFLILLHLIDQIIRQWIIHKELQFLQFPLKC